MEKNLNTQQVSLSAEIKAAVDEVKAQVEKARLEILSNEVVLMEGLDEDPSLPR